MQNRIKWQALGVSSYAIAKPGESESAAVCRSIGALAGVGRVSARKTGTITADRARQEIQITVLGKESRRSGWPVLAEFRIWEDANG